MAATFELHAFFDLLSSPSAARRQSNPRPLVFSCRSGASLTPAVPASYAETDASKRERTVIRLGLPSKGRMADETLALLKNCQLTVRQVNPRQYVADIPQVSNPELEVSASHDLGHDIWASAPPSNIGHDVYSPPPITGSPVEIKNLRALATFDSFFRVDNDGTANMDPLPNLEVWFQRPKDIVRKLQSGDFDLGIVGLDTVCEHGQENEDLVLVHEELKYGDCRLSIAIPMYGIFENVNSLEDLAKMSHWTKERPLRIATGFSYLGQKFVNKNGLTHVRFSTADGALEAAPAMGIADAIMDLVSSGTTLRENYLKEIKDGVVLESQAVLVGSKKSLIERTGVLDITHEILERLEAHLRAIGQFTVTANMTGNSPEAIAEKILGQASLFGLQGPTISPVYSRRDGKAKVDYYAIVICVARKDLYKSVKQLRSIGGSGVLVSPLTYIFEEETPRWQALLQKLGM